MLCDDLVGWDGRRLGGSEAKEGGEIYIYIYIYMTDLGGYMTETNTTF